MKVAGGGQGNGKKIKQKINLVRVATAVKYMKRGIFTSTHE